MLRRTPADSSWSVTRAPPPDHGESGRRSSSDVTRSTPFCSFPIGEDDNEGIRSRKLANIDAILASGEEPQVWILRGSVAHDPLHVTLIHERQRQGRGASPPHAGAWVSSRAGLVA